MATKKNGNGNLEAAMALLIQNQAAFVAGMHENSKQFAENAKQFVEIRKDLDIIKALLIQHEQTLERLPEAIRDKIGFKAK